MDQHCLLAAATHEQLQPMARAGSLGTGGTSGRLCALALAPQRACGHSRACRRGRESARACRSVLQCACMLVSFTCTWVC